MKICLITTSLSMGGAETQVCMLADYFHKLGHEVIIVCLTGKVIVTPDEKTIRIVNLNMSKGVMSFIYGLNKVKEILNSFNPDIVHSHMVHANLFARALRLICPINKLICSAHNSYEGGRVRMLLYRFTDFLCNLTTNCSKHSANCSVSRGAVPKNKILVQYNGIDTQLFKFSEAQRLAIRNQLDVKNDEFMIFSIGRLTVAKDFSNLIQSIKLLDNKKLKVFIAGDGPLKNDIETEIAKYQLDNNIRLLGLCKNIVNFLNASDVFVLPSAWEGFPIVIGEAMASELLVVTTNAGGAKEWFPDDFEDLVVPIKNPQLLANAINKILDLSNFERKTKASQLRHHVVSNFNIEVISKNWIELYKSI